MITERSTLAERKSPEFQGGRPEWSGKGKSPKAKADVFITKESKSFTKASKMVAKHFNMRGNVAAFQSLEMFNLCISILGGHCCMYFTRSSVYLFLPVRVTGNGDAWALWHSPRMSAPYNFWVALLVVDSPFDVCLTSRSKMSCSMTKLWPQKKKKKSKQGVLKGFQEVVSNKRSQFQSQVKVHPMKRSIFGMGCTGFFVKRKWKKN